jgi:hypothetical protein
MAMTIEQAQLMVEDALVRLGARANRDGVTVNYDGMDLTVGMATTTQEELAATDRTGRYSWMRRACLKIGRKLCSDYMIAAGIPQISGPQDLLMRATDIVTIVAALPNVPTAVA